MRTSDFYGVVLLDSAYVDHKRVDQSIGVTNHYAYIYKTPNRYADYAFVDENYD